MDESVTVNASDGENSCGKSDNTRQQAFLEYLSSAYEVLRKIFSYLYLEDIENAAAAFESWRTVAEVIRNERSSIESFVLSDKKYKISKIWCDAAFCVSFCTAPKTELHGEVTKYLTPTGEYIPCFSGAGVIGTVHDLSHIVQQNVRIGLSLPSKTFYMTALRFPNVPKVGIKTFVWEEYMDFETFKNKFDIPKDQIIKCLLILIVADGNERRAREQKDDFIHFLHSRQKESFAIGGSVIDDFMNYARCGNSHSVTKYIVFYGDNVDAASTVLTAEVNSVNGINNKIEKLKEMCPVAKKGALFVFRCTGRQRVIRGSQSRKHIVTWEGEAIQKYFPSTPVVGCFGYGEIGREHPYENKSSVPLKKMKWPFNWDFSFSTSIVYVGFMA